MTPENFKESWNNLDEPLFPISFERLTRFGLLPLTMEFLSIAGLPKYASPFLSFSNGSDDIYYGINKLTDQYAFLKDALEYEKYIVIGSCRDGDPIAINTEDNDQIVELDHEDLFSPTFFNSSLMTLAGFLIIYEDFKASVLAEHGEEGQRNGYFTDIQFDKLKNQMFKIDHKALTEQGFWKEELEIMLLNRQDYLSS
jgi:hypothetical protein